MEKEIGARVLSSRRMPGGIVAAVHRLIVEREASGQRESVVLRQYEQRALGDVEREAHVLRKVAEAGLPAPRLLAASATGAETDGYPSILMSRLQGRPELTPAEPQSWLVQMADVAVRIHEAAIEVPGFEPWIDPSQLTVPTSATRPALWRTLARVLSEGESPYTPRFIHRDFQHFNLLWSRGKLTGVVDWGGATSGPSDIDVGHCRLNLAVLFGADWAERFRAAYEARAGRAVDPWWDLHALASYSDSWQQFIPVQVNGRARVDVAGMTARVEELVQVTLRRF
ncbi:phosphotransferase family protein [Actinospica robiniae]|uniref:phosphotransferase family protein n=1 Tax=Actinospica robiniae TaxID=304901 RepID=UPI0005532C9B|nr:aminoglycoside phosphotransferase family protein [Actinospica robiniae]